MKELGPTIRQFAKRLRHGYASEIAADPWGFKRKAKRLLGQYLPPGPGRPRKETITRAHELHCHRTPWPEIYSQCIPNYASLRWGERRLEIGRLRNGVRGRQRLDGKGVRRRPQFTERQPHQVALGKCQRRRRLGVAKSAQGPRRTAQRAAKPRQNRPFRFT